MTARSARASVDSARAALLQRAQPSVRAAVTSRGAISRVDHRRRLTVLVVRGDGARVLRVSFPRRRALVGAGALAFGVALLGALVGDWWALRQRMLDVAPLLAQLDAERATIDGFHRRVAELRREVASWRELHARIWEPFGPDMAPLRPQRGMGGARAAAEREAPGSPVDELDLLAEQVRQEGESLRALDRLIGRARKALAALPSRWPVRGPVNSEFGHRASPWSGEREFHGGIDIGAPPGTPVRAPAAGTVVFAGPQPEYGLTVVLDHGQEIRTVYGHLSRIRVQEGQRVERGAELGLTGNTGRSSGPHLHYEILVQGRPVNPRAYFWD